MYVAETGERGLRSAREVAEVLGLPTLALVPRLEPAPARRHRAPGLCAGPAALALRRGAARGADRAPAAPRGRRAGAGPRARVVLVTSALPGRGQVDADLEPRPHRRRRGPAGDGDRCRPAQADRCTIWSGSSRGRGWSRCCGARCRWPMRIATDPRLPLKLLPGSQRLLQPTRLLGPGRVRRAADRAAPELRPDPGRQRAAGGRGRRQAAGQARRRRAVRRALRRHPARLLRAVPARPARERGRWSPVPC